MNTLVYYENHNGQYVTYDLDTNEIAEIDILSKYKNRYCLTKPFTASHQGLISFAQRLISDRNAVKHVIDIFESKFHSKKTGKTEHFYKTSNNIVLNFFKRNSQFSKVNNNASEITMEEYNISEQCYNAGIYYGDKLEIDAYSYDFRMFYPSILANKNFYFPVDCGQWYEFNEMPSATLCYGYYNCKIIVTNTDALKIFMPSKNNYYTHFDIQLAQKLKQKYPDEVTIEPLGWCYIYENEALESGQRVFGNWYKKLVELKRDYPKNIVVKMLSSSLWGYLSSKNTFKVYEHEIDETYDLALDMDSVSDTTTHVICDMTIRKNDECNNYTLLNVNKSPQKYNFRLKSFVTSFGRLHMLKTLYPVVDKIVKVNTDGFLVTEELRYTQDKTINLIYEGFNRYNIKSSQKAEIVN